MATQCEWEWKIEIENKVMIIDAHHHLWDRSQVEFDYSWQETPELEKLCRDYLPSDLQPLIEQAGVDKTVLVQTQHHVEENRWALRLAQENDFIAGVVGWVDLASPECESQLLEFKDNPLFVGIRHVTQDEPDDDFIVSDEVGRGLAVLEKLNVPFDLLFYSKHLKHAATVADRFPNLRLVIDHLSKPEIKAGKLQTWQRDLAEAAKRPNVFCKLSGMATEADWENWKPADFQPFVEAAIETFTPERLMFGSDWPVCRLAASYQDVFDALQECIDALSDTEKSTIMGGTAKRFYQLEA